MAMAAAASNSTEYLWDKTSIDLTFLPMENLRHMQSTP